MGKRQRLSSPPLREEEEEEEEDEEELYRDFLHNSLIDYDDDDEEYVLKLNEEEEDEEDEDDEEEEEQQHEVHTRSMPQIEFVELPEEIEEEEEEDDEDEEEVLPLWDPKDSDSEDSNDEAEQAVVAVTQSAPVEEDDHEEKELYHPWIYHLGDTGQDDDEEGEGEDEEDADSWKQESTSSSSSYEEDEAAAAALVGLSRNELLELTPQAQTLLLPEDIRRIRHQVRTHVQLLCQVLMFSASGGKRTMFQMYSRLLQDIVDLGAQTELEHSILKPYSQPLTALLQRSLHEFQNTTPLVKDKPTWQMPIVHRFQQILTDLAPQLGFSTKLYPTIPKQKQPIFSSESEDKRKNWRTWTEDELELVAMGFARFGNGRGLANQIYESLLSSRQPHTITRLICEAQGKKKDEERFKILLDCLKVSREGGAGVLLSENEHQRLLHGVAVQCKVRGIIHLCDLNFDSVSIDFLPHRSGAVLKTYFEHLCVIHHQ